MSENEKNENVQKVISWENAPADMDRMYIAAYANEAGVQLYTIVIFAKDTKEAMLRAEQAGIPNHEIPHLIKHKACQCQVARIESVLPVAKSKLELVNIPNKLDDMNPDELLRLVENSMGLVEKPRNKEEIIETINNAELEKKPTQH